MPKAPPPSLRLLGQVLAQARADLGRSPEQIGAAIPITGRTIRRIEAGAGPPRAVTLETLAEYYALNAPFLRRLAAQSDRSQDLLEAELRAEAATVLGGLPPLEEPGGVLVLAMRLARQGQTPDRMAIARHHAREDEVAAVVHDFVRLDRPRRELVRAVIRDLVVARRQEQGARTAGEPP
jgi:transcriptional regulator with XRE-family HTH domain